MKPFTMTPLDRPTIGNIVYTDARLGRHSRTLQMLSLVTGLVLLGLVFTMFGPTLPGLIALLEKALMIPVINASALSTIQTGFEKGTWIKWLSSAPQL